MEGDGWSLENEEIDFTPKPVVKEIERPRSVQKASRIELVAEVYEERMDIICSLIKVMDPNAPMPKRSRFIDNIIEKMALASGTAGAQVSLILYNYNSLLNFVTVIEIVPTSIILLVYIIRTSNLLMIKIGAFFMIFLIMIIQAKIILGCMTFLGHLLF